MPWRQWPRVDWKPSLKRGTRGARRLLRTCRTKTLAESSGDSSDESPNRSHHARRHRHRRRKAPGQGSDSERTFDARRESQDMDPNESSPAASTASSPNGIRTRVSTLRGWCPWPLDDGAGHPFGPSQTIRSGRDPHPASRSDPTSHLRRKEAEPPVDVATGPSSARDGRIEPPTRPSPTAVGPGEENWLGGEDSNPQ